jgi:tetratricopeptide (TPR) repeat protein
MPSRIQFGRAVLALLLPALIAVTGCATGMAAKKPGARSGAGQATNAAETADYSEGAVSARTAAYAHYSTAILHELNDNLEKAADQFYEAALANPADEALVMEASERLLRIKIPDRTRELQQRERALEVLKKATDKPGAGGELYARMGLAYAFLGKKDPAIEADRMAIKKAPESFAGYQYLAQVYLQNKQIDEGLKVLDDASKQPGTDAAFLVELGDLSLAFARGGATNTVKGRAGDAYKRATLQKPDNPFLLQRLAEGLSATGESDLAAQTYLVLLEKFPEAPGIRDRLIEIYIRKEDRAKAAEQLRVVVREAPTNPQAQFLLGSVLFEDKNAAEAAECFKKTILLSPSFEPAYYDLALVQINLNQPQDALDTLRKARGKFQENFVGEFYAGLAYGRMKDHTNSLHHLTSAEVIARATATNRLTHTFYFQLGAASERSGRLDDAEKYFRKAIARSPDFAEALNYLGYMWADRGENLTEARAMIEKALKLEPENGAFLDSMGWVLFKLNEPEEALKYILKAVERAEEPDPTLLDHLGDIYAALKKTDKARESWEKAAAIEPNDIREQLRKKLGASTSTPAGVSGPP